MQVARQRRGLTKTDLAAMSGISGPTLSKWENGQSSPRPENVAKLAEALHFPVEFFYADEAPLVSAETVSFRALSTMRASRRDEVTATAGMAVLLDEWLAQRFSRPDPSIPDLSHLTPKAAAEALRMEWGLGTRPIPNLLHLLEAHGVRIYSVARRSTPKRKVDGLSTWYEGIPFVFLDVSATPERHRFSAAHELGHLVMHPPGHTVGKLPEREANEFAGCLLVPSDDLYANAPRGVTLASLRQVKQRWKVAASALLYRLHEEDLVEDWHYRQLVIQLRTQYGDSEPTPREESFETSQVLGKVFAMLRERGVSRRDVAGALRMSVDDLESMIFAHVPTLAVKGDPPGRAPDRESEKGEHPMIELLD